MDYPSGHYEVLPGFHTEFQVGQIATVGLFTCDIHDDPVQICQRAEHQGIDQIPVRDNGAIVGVVQTSDFRSDLSISSVMSPLTDQMIISSSAPIQDLLELFETRSETYFRLVVQSGEINGIITRSDILKLPVRIHAFALIANLELLMAKVIRNEWPHDDDWLQLLSESRRNKTRGKWNQAKSDRLDPPLLEFTEFCDKRDIIKKRWKQSKAFESELKQVEKLRDEIAHASNYVDSRDSLLRFLERLRLARNYLKILSAPLTESDSQ